jgi:hypothetical protein
MLLLLFFSCVLFELLPTLHPLSFLFLFPFFPDPCAVFIITSLTLFTLIHLCPTHLVRQFSCCKNRFLVQPAAVNPCIVCETGRGLRLDA